MAERRFAAMGTTVHLIGVAARGSEPECDALLDGAEARVHHLEAQWSRFRPTSELTRINERAGTATTVTPGTFDLVAAAIDGWHRTNGLFDPTLLGAVEAVGYDRSFDELPADRPVPASATTSYTAAIAGCGDIELDGDACTVFLPPGIGLDLGGIAKGHTADLVAGELLDAGLDGVCANLGGDVRVRGSAPDGGAWMVDIQDPTSSTTALALLEIDDGAVVTSTRLRRRWLVDGVEHHHLIDPRTRRSAFNGWVQVSVIGATATEAEVLAKAVFLAGPVHDLLEASGARAVLVADDGNVATIGFERRTVRGGWARGAGHARARATSESGAFRRRRDTHRRVDGGRVQRQLDGHVDRDEHGRDDGTGRDHEHGAR